MLTYNEAFHTLSAALQAVYDKQEAMAIAKRYMEDLTGMTYTERLMKRDEEMTADMQARFDADKPLLTASKPLQQIIGYEWFLNRRFIVNEHVLIPRPETEELVEWIIDDYKENGQVCILDIGTGSGCIPISLKLALSGAEITSCDISADAIAVAKENSENLNASVLFLQLDFLNEGARNELPVYDIVVSNPPYIPQTETETLHSNVTAFEPHLALFVPGDDALLFYREIALFGQKHLHAMGAIYCELHVDFAEDTARLFEALGYVTVLRKDMHGNLRMLKAQKIV